MGLSFAQGKFTQDFLAKRGIRPAGVIWRWNAGVKGGVFEDHKELNRTKADNEFAFPDHHHPDSDVNAEWCQCQLQTVWRDDRGRFAKSLPPVNAAMEEVLNRISLLETKGPIMAAVSEPQIIEVTIPDGAIVVNVAPPKEPIVNVTVEPQIALEPPQVTVNVEPTPVHVEAPLVTVEAPIVNVAPPEVTVQAPAVTVVNEVQTPEVLVSAPDVIVKPNIVVPVADTKPRKMRVLRDAAGVITGSEEV